MSSGKKSPLEKYTVESGRVFLSGNQALVRLPLDQARKDRATGLKTGGFISGYRGSPLGHLDQDLAQAKKLLEASHIRFQPGVNEDMAANSIWGSQQIGFHQPTFDGVFGLWYSKGPGVDRAGDALRHANLWGTAPHGGVIMAVGDDPMARSSSTQQQSEQTLASFCIPSFHAANVQDIYDFGLIGWALSRYAGVWVAIKGVSDIYESWLAVDLDPARTATILPADHVVPALGAHTRWPDRSVDQDTRMLTVRLPAVRAFAKANKLNRTTHPSGAKRRFGIVSAGKSWMDTVEALQDLGIGDAQRAEIGLEVFKVGLVWPLEGDGLRDFAAGLDQLLVIEESRPFLEPQIKDALYNLPADQRPQVLGKRDADGRDWFASHGELTPAEIARVLARWLAPHFDAPSMRDWIGFLDQTDAALAQHKAPILRTPYFCSGCPHNSSTKTPEGSNQLAGIGCHYLVHLMDRKAISYPQMGGEGAVWIGAQDFVADKHIFTNLGDGTYYHSGSLAIRAAIASNTNITYKILYNDAVAMTGGQSVDGPIGVPQIAQSLQAEGVAALAVVSSDPTKWRFGLPAGVRLHHRDELDAIQREFREIAGVTVIIYEQTCATELRRRRSRKLTPDPAVRALINDRVCEGCGDCSIQSNCLSVQPLETDYGRKRVIDQSACNKDFSCLKGFCPSFVTIEGGALAKGKGVTIDDALFAALPTPSVQATTTPYGVMVAGIGGTGVVTISNLIAAAAQREGKFAQALDLTGMAQKFGAVYCHLKIADRPDALTATRLSVGQAHLMIGADVVTAGADEALSRLRAGQTCAIVNHHETVTGAFTRDPNFSIPVATLKKSIAAFTGPDRAFFYDTSDLSWLLTGDTIGANVMLLGFACQKGWLPVTLASLETAIQENGVAVPYNLKAFKLGRLLAQDPDALLALAAASHAPRDSLILSQTSAERIARRAQDLVAYQDQAYADRFGAVIRRVQEAEQRVNPSATALTDVATRTLYKLMAYKDEYEVARLHTDGEFLKTIADQFTGDYKITFHMAPPLLSDIDPHSGRPIKRAYGAGMFWLMKQLAKLKGLRGGALDPFGYSAERKEDRKLIADYEALLAELTTRLTPDTLASATAVAAAMEGVRGYGPVRAEAIAKARAEQARLLEIFRRGGANAGVGKAAA